MDLSQLLEMDQLPPGFLSGIDKEIVEIVFPKKNYSHLSPIQPDKQQQIAQAVFNSLIQVMGYDWLLIWHMQYGISDAIRFGLFLTPLMNVQETIHELELLLDELDEIQSGIESLTRPLVREGGDQGIEDQNGNLLKGGQLYVFGARQGLSYALHLLQLVVENRFEIKPSGRLNIPATMAGFGVFADQQCSFVENVLPKLQKIFEDRPSSILVQHRRS